MRGASGVMGYRQRRWKPSLATLLFCTLSIRAGSMEKIKYWNVRWSNPFLHLSLHLAIEEQLAINQPPGIADLFRQLLNQRGDKHAALHVVLDALAETLWRSQRDKSPLDSNVYLDLLRHAVNQG
jgi:Domain of unknown function (DUF1841)